MAMTHGLRQLRRWTPLAAATAVATAATLTSATPAAAAEDFCSEVLTITASGLIVSGTHEYRCRDHQGHVTYEEDLPAKMERPEPHGTNWTIVATGTGDLQYFCPEATHDGSLVRFRILAVSRDGERNLKDETLAACDEDSL